MESELEKALVAWFNTFDLPETVKLESLEDFYDGLILTEIMSKMLKFEYFFKVLRFFLVRASFLISRTLCQEPMKIGALYTRI